MGGVRVGWRLELYRWEVRERGKLIAVGVWRDRSEQTMNEFELVMRDSV